MKRARAKVSNELGIHARPAAEFVRLARTFQSEIWICRSEGRFSAKSILEVLTANLDRGSMVTIEAAGPDEGDALRRLVELLHEIAAREREHP